MSKAISKYLKIYCDKIILNKPDYIPNFDYVLVIPAYNEGSNFVNNLLNIITNAQKPVLIIVVINAPLGACPKKNQNLSMKIQALGQGRKITSALSLIDIRESSVALCGPYFLPSDKGVGLARKMGADWALSLISAGKISCPVIFSTDADALLPSTYFQSAHESMGMKNAALVFPFVHKRPEDPDLRQAIELYERRLNLYVQGLAFAGSPYAFHTVGSALAINAESYAQVRGFPCRAAGEDFYVLNKLRKIGTVGLVSCPPLVLSSRVSNRVPFGTGPALSKLLKESSIKDAKIFYNPQAFEILKELLMHVEQQLFNNSTNLLSGLSIRTKNAFESLRGANRLQQNLESRKSCKDRLKAFHDWFDGFLTLKFIHNLREQGLDMCSLDEL